MAGHSHWQNIKYKKARKDIKKEYGKISKGIMSAVRTGGPSLKENSVLALRIEAAKKIGFPKVKIQIAIKSGFGDGSGNEEIKVVLVIPLSLYLLLLIIETERLSLLRIF